MAILLCPGFKIENNSRKQKPSFEKLTENKKPPKVHDGG
jgi:hypothetical protein